MDSGPQVGVGCVSVYPDRSAVRGSHHDSRWVVVLNIDIRHVLFIYLLPRPSYVMHMIRFQTGISRVIHHLVEVRDARADLAAQSR